MIILKELHKIKSLMETNTGLQVQNISVDIEEGELSVWVSLYDKDMDIAYTISTKVDENVLTQFSNNRSIREIVEQLIREWAEIAKDVFTVH
jgi:hypothetical protein